MDIFSKNKVCATKYTIFMWDFSIDRQDSKNIKGKKPITSTNLSSSAEAKI
jgi:hypothetical protein